MTDTHHRIATTAAGAAIVIYLVWGFRVMMVCKAVPWDHNPEVFMTLVAGMWTCMAWSAIGFFKPNP